LLIEIKQSQLNLVLQAMEKGLVDIKAWVLSSKNAVLYTIFLEIKNI